MVEASGTLGYYVNKLNSWSLAIISIITHDEVNQNQPKLRNQATFHQLLSLALSHQLPKSDRQAAGSHFFPAAGNTHG
jgi:hypothetical protein